MVTRDWIAVESITNFRGGGDCAILGQGQGFQVGCALLLEGDSFARSSDRFAQFDDSSVMSEFRNENKNKNSLSQVTEVVI